MHSPFRSVILRLALATAVLIAVPLGICSCSEPQASLSAVSATVVLDYDGTDSPPRMSLSVFAQPPYQAERVRTVSIFHAGSGYEWSADDPVVLPVRKANGWTGYMNFVPVEGEAIPQGLYTCTCTDAAFERSDAVFSVSYPEELLSLAQDDALRFIRQRGAYAEYTALYDKEGVLIYYGEQKAGRDEFPTARFHRSCYLLDGGTVICMLGRNDLP